MDSNVVLDSSSQVVFSTAEKEIVPFEIDYLGNDSFQVTQLNLLTRRSIEPNQNSDAQLSARGLHHRSRAQFERDIRSSTNIIMLSSLHGVAQNDAEEGQSPQPEFHLFTQYFQRALAYERVGQIDLAISDYNTVLSIYRDYAPAHFNRAGLYNAQGHTELALSGINHALTLDPSNLSFRKNKCLLLRQKGDYMEAINETMIYRAVLMQPSLGKDLIAGNKISMPDASQLLLSFKESSPVDEVSLAMDWLKEKSLHDAGRQHRRRQNVAELIHNDSNHYFSLGKEASQDAVADFLSEVKFFGPYCSNRSIMREFVSQLEMVKVEKEEIVYRNSDIGHSFYVVLWGEVALLSDLMLNSNGRNKILSDANFKSLTRFGRAQIFGEEAVAENTTRSVERSMNAICTQSATLLVMVAADYYRIARTYDTELRGEMKNILLNCKIFADFEESKIDYLVSKMKLIFHDIATEILVSGQAVKDICIVRKGVVKLIKSLPRPVINRTERTTISTISAQTSSLENATQSMISTSDSLPPVCSPPLGPFDHRKCTAWTSTCVGEVDIPLTATRMGSGSLSRVGPPGLWVLEKSWREHSDEDKWKSSKSAMQRMSQARPSCPSAASGLTNFASSQNTDATKQAKQVRDLRNTLRTGAFPASTDRASAGTDRAPGQRNLVRTGGAHKSKSSSSDGAYKEKDSWSSTVGLLGTGQIFGEICVLNPKIMSAISGVAFTKVELFTIAGEELVAQGIRFDPGSMNLLNQSFNLYNPPAEKVAYYFKSKYAWEREKEKVVSSVLKVNPRIQARLQRKIER